MALILFTHTKTWNFLKRDGQDSWEKQDNILVEKNKIISLCLQVSQVKVLSIYQRSQDALVLRNKTTVRDVDVPALLCSSSAPAWTSPPPHCSQAWQQRCVYCTNECVYIWLYIYIYTHNQHNKQYWILGRKSKRGVQRLCWILMMRKVRDRTGTGS